MAIRSDVLLMGDIYMALLYGSFAKETCNFKEPPKCSHPIVTIRSDVLLVGDFKYNKRDL